MSSPVPFDLLGPLPTGTTILEASAGTGKTYTIAALATRYIVQGAATIDQMLMITFGRGATRELRERVREYVTLARDTLTSDATSHEDPVIDDLLSHPTVDRGLAVERLSRAVADFDAATIATTHEFCSRALAGLGVMSDTDPGEVFVDTIADLVDEVVDDFYLRKYANAPSGTPRLDLKEARDLANRAVGDPSASLDAGPAEDGSIEQIRVSFAIAVRAEVLRRRRDRRLVTFDDLIMRLREVLLDERTGPASCERLRDRYRVVLVDEFQDTDPAQWDILRAAFHTTRTLILIGDPKQAIYAFRGADVFSYLDAADQADHRATLPTNFRSDAAVVSGVEALMGDLQLGDPRIVVHPVGAYHQQPRLTGVGEQRVRLRWLPAEEPPTVDEARAAVARDVAADIVGLLTGPARLTTGRGPRAVEPGDVAVLVGQHSEGALVQAALADVGIPAVVQSTLSIFRTRSANQWSVLLTAMQRPRGSALRDAATTDFLGFTVDEIALHGERIDTEVGMQLRQWAHILEHGSVAEMVAAMERDRHVTARILRRADGERDVTDLHHVAGELHAQQRRTRAGLAALLGWLTEERRLARAKEGSSERTRRLETDAAAVQVMTIHGSKGLQFPIAYVPFAWSRWDVARKQILLCHDPSGRRILDVRGVDGIDREDLLAAHNAEEAGERLRLLYVALTRACHQVVVHWAPTKRNTASSPLHRVLCAGLEGTSQPSQTYPSMDPPLPRSPWVTVEQIQERPTRRWQPASPDPVVLTAAPFDRAIDVHWRRTSYSGLTRAVHEAESAPAAFRDDEPVEIVEPSAGEAAGQASPFADMPAGAAFGTLVHAVLESVDTQAADLRAEVFQRCAEGLIRHPVTGVEATSLGRALLPTFATPLGSLASDSTLAQVRNSDRLAELDFELPMAQGAPRTISDIADVLRRHLPADDPLRGYADRLDTVGLREATLAGYLTGSIDVVLRVPGPDPRFLVVDYKTNLLRDPRHPGVENTLDGYGPEAMADAMMDAHYPLQALLYSAALHRYLRWRMPGYEARRHLGGVLYLFLRGMGGPETPPGHGVFSWHPPAAMIVELSGLLDGGSS